MSEKKKSKKGCIVSLVMTVLGCLFMGFMLIMAAASAVNTEGGRQESVTTVQSSNLNTYINTRSTEQIAIVNAAQNEHTNRGGTETRGGDSYIETLTPDQVSHPESSTTSGSSSSQPDSPMNINWNCHFVGQIMTNAGLDLFFRKLIEKGKFGFAYKKIMTDPTISLAAKVIFAYITAYCPKGRIWYFKKSQIVEELGISAYVLNKALKELSALELIDMTVSQYEISIMNMYDSSEKEGHESSNNEDITAEKGGHETPKKEDTEVKKQGHEQPTNEDREQYNSYQYNFYQSSPISHIEEESENDGLLREGMSEEEIKELVDTDISTDSFKKHNYYYFIIVLTKYAENACYVKRLNDLLENKELSLASFTYAFLQRYEFKSKGMNIKNPISYMTTCLYEFITHYDYLKDEVRCSKSGSGYGPSYNIEEFESSSFLDDF